MPGLYRLGWDDLSDGRRGAGPRWAYRTFGALVGDEGESTSRPEQKG